MITFIGGRQTGKTTKIIETANTLTHTGHPVTVLVRDRSAIDFMHKNGLCGTITIITIDEFCSRYCSNEFGHTSLPKDFLIDDSEYFIRRLIEIRGGTLAAMSLSADPADYGYAELLSPVEGKEKGSE